MVWIHSRATPIRWASSRRRKITCPVGTRRVSPAAVSAAIVPACCGLHPRPVADVQAGAAAFIEALVGVGEVPPLRLVGAVMLHCKRGSTRLGKNRPLQSFQYWCPQLLHTSNITPSRRLLLRFPVSPEQSRLSPSAISARTSKQSLTLAGLSHRRQRRRVAHFRFAQARGVILATLDLLHHLP